LPHSQSVEEATLLSDLTIEAFLILRDAFFDKAGVPIPFSLREKRNTQDDPLDEYIALILTDRLTNASCQKAPGPLISPDLVIYRQDACESLPSELLKDDLSRIVAIEVKKLERSMRGQIARSTGLDYNTTPPCGTIRIYDKNDRPLNIRGFYLFVCQETAKNGKSFISALTLCDGNVLNEDFDLYMSITSQRQKEVGLGTYGDGANRNRPMLIFANPLGTPQLDHSSSLVSEVDLSGVDSRISLAYHLDRTIPDGSLKHFFIYRKAEDIPSDWKVQDLLDPFPQPTSRVSVTQARGRFRLPISLATE
jgi:hypothetical protein